MCIELFQEPKRIARFVGVFIFSMTLVALNGFWQMANGTDLLGHSIDIPGRFFRMRSSFRAPPILASFFLVAMPLMFFLWFREKKWSLKSSSLAFLLALFGVAFLATLSRAALVGFFLSVILHVFFTRKKWASLLVLAAPLPLLLPKSLRYNFFGSLNLKDITVGQRLGFWQAAFEMIREHPFLGQGIQTYRVKLPDFAPPSVLGIDLDAHNCYLQLWSEIGLWGLLAFLIPFAYFLGKEAARGLQADFPLKHALWIGITAFLIQSLFDNNFYNFQLSVLFWSFWGMYAALVK